MSTRSHRLFTVAEANALLPELREIFAELKVLNRRIRELAPLTAPAAERAREGGGCPQGGSYLQALLDLETHTERIAEMGVLVKDLERGLCDFLYDNGGHLVQLCWQEGEDRIGWWHGLDEGFRGRRPIGELNARER
ncbi:MAG: DUF2203 domain-containing protein [Nitrospirota bacterium]|nr:DUF2203 domain-containing protein [Nitrospirota bacterium]